MRVDESEWESAVKPERDLQLLINSHRRSFSFNLVFRKVTYPNATFVIWKNPRYNCFRAPSNCQYCCNIVQSMFVDNDEYMRNSILFNYVSSTLQYFLSCIVQFLCIFSTLHSAFFFSQGELNDLFVWTRLEKKRNCDIVIDVNKSTCQVKNESCPFHFQSTQNYISALN